MQGTSLTGLADDTLEKARRGTTGRASCTVHGGRAHTLRQTLMALLAGQELAEHASPGEATLQVVRGHVRLIVDGDAWDGVEGDHVTIPLKHHSLLALEDSAVLLTFVAPR